MSPGTYVSVPRLLYNTILIAYLTSLSSLLGEQRISPAKCVERGAGNRRARVCGKKEREFAQISAPASASAPSGVTPARINTSLVKTFNGSQATTHTLPFAIVKS